MGEIDEAYDKAYDEGWGRMNQSPVVPPHFVASFIANFVGHRVVGKIDEAYDKDYDEGWGRRNPFPFVLTPLPD